MRDDLQKRSLRAAPSGAGHRSLVKPAVVSQPGVPSGTARPFTRTAAKQRRFSLSLSAFDLAIFLVFLPTSLVAIGYLVGRELPSLSSTARALKFAGMEMPAAPSGILDSDLPSDDESSLGSESVVDNILPPDDVSPARDSGSANPTLQNEIKRIQQYENQLRKRASFLEAILDDLERMDYDFNEITSSQAEPRRRAGRRRLGLGGADGPRSPVIHGPRSSVIVDAPDDESSSSVVIEPERKDSAKQKSEPRATADIAPSSVKNASANVASAVARRVPILLQDLDSKLARIATVPLGAPVQGDLSSPFGYRRSPFSGEPHMHSGLDFAVERASSVIATADGTVINAGRKGAYGNTVIIRHGRRVETLYGHLSRILVEPGQRICRGQQIGLVGSSGRSTGPHLHYEVRIDGDAVDPARFVRLASFFRFIDPERGMGDFTSDATASNGTVATEQLIKAEQALPAVATSGSEEQRGNPEASEPLLQFASLQLFHPFTHTATIPFLSGP